MPSVVLTPAPVACDTGLKVFLSAADVDIITVWEFVKAELADAYSRRSIQIQKKAIKS